MPKVGEAQPGPLKILLYGRSGTGKTLLSLTCGKSAIILDLDTGVESAMGKVRKEPDKFTQDRLEVEHVPIPELQPHIQATQYEKVLMGLIGIANYCTGNPGQYPYKVLIIDSFTLLCDAALRYILRNTGRLNRKIDVKENVTLPEWGLMIGEIEKIVNLIRGLPIHVILVAHTEPLLNASDQLIREQLAVPTRKLPPKIPAYFDEQWYLEVTELGGRGKQRVLRTEASNLFDAKSRAGLRDMTDVNLGMKEIFKQLGREI